MLWMPFVFHVIKNRCHILVISIEYAIFIIGPSTKGLVSINNSIVILFLADSFHIKEYEFMSWFKVLKLINWYMIIPVKIMNNTWKITNTYMSVQRVE